MKINKKGFTLIELLVVIAIIGLLSTLAVISLNNARQKSRDARRVSDVKQIQTALELYYTDQNGYPTEEGNLGDNTHLCISDTGIDATCGSTATYMSKVPTNPSPYDATGATGYYVYGAKDTSSVALNDAYSIQYYLGAATGGISSGLNTACANGISGCAAQ